MTDKEPKELSSRIRQWEKGQPLSFAWFGCASHEARRHYQDCDSDARRASLRLDMQFDVLDALISGKLVALGMRGGAPIEEGPTPIPAHLFPRGAEDTAEIDWDASALQSSGFSFKRIRVAKPTRAPRIKKAAEQTVQANALPEEHGHESDSCNYRMGRPSKVEQIRQIIRQMGSEHWDFGKRFQKESCQKIIDLAEMQGFDTSKGYSEPVLKRLIREVCGRPA